MSRAADITIDEMRAEDISAVCTLFYSVSELGVSASFDSPERIRSYLERNPGFSSVARKEEHVVGAILCGHDGRRGSFYHAVVLPEYRGAGIARRMVDRSLSSLKERGITTAFLFTHEQNKAAQSFWKEIGWEYCPGVQYHCLDFGSPIV